MNLKLLNLLLEMLAIVIVPLSDLDIEEVVIKILNTLKVLLKKSLKLLKALLDLWAFRTSENRHSNLWTLPCKL
jgi:hypothetical protein